MIAAVAVAIIQEPSGFIMSSKLEAYLPIKLGP